jgi:pimeloyl-ACP methyl ester carboxylesterase
MRWLRQTRWILAVSSVASICLCLAGRDCRGDSVIMKNGMVYRGLGTPDRDNTLVFISDGLKKIVVRDSKIERIEANNAFRGGERFQLVQPIVVHGGLMPKEVVSVEAGAWNDRGRRSFRYIGSRLDKSIRMEQAIIDITPHIVKLRGVDGFWVSVLDTNQVPRPVITSLLDKVERKNVEERERAVRFLMDVGWHAEAEKALDQVVRDFPDAGLKERAETARRFIHQAEAQERRFKIDVSRKAQQFHRATKLLKSLGEKGNPTELQIEARELERQEEQQRAADKTLLGDLHKLSAGLPSAERGFWKNPSAEVQKAMEAAPDAVRDRFGSWRKAKAQKGTPDQAQFALAMSGYVAGPELAGPELKRAELFWKARDLILQYVSPGELASKSEHVAGLDALDWTLADASTDMVKRLEILTAIIERMPPLRMPEDEEVTTDKPMLHRVEEEEGNEPTQYAVRLPPEYHPLRSYPAVLLLHSGKGPEAVIGEWADEAARRGFILIAPEYTTAGHPSEYGYSPSEHAAAQLALRDARKRYAIDSDRVFAAGQLSGGNMAWDLALAHPDQFAGVVVIGGLPAKYVLKYLPHHDRLPLFYVIGDLAPAANEFIFTTFVKPMIAKAWDVTYIEYFRRGLEALPEEIPTAFDWMSRHRRDPFPKTFKAYTARTSDDRYNGVVVREFAAGVTTAPEAAEVLGKNLNPGSIEMKSVGLSNMIRLDIKGITALDLWLSPKLIDFNRKAEIRINGRSRGRANKLKLDMQPLLEDLRVRGDRQQLYWYRMSAP